MVVESEPQFLNLLICCVTLVASVVLCHYAFPRLKQLREVRQKSTHRILTAWKRSKSKSKERLTSLLWLGKTIVLWNVFKQLYFFEYYVVQRALFRGERKHSPMHDICRANRFLLVQPFFYVLCAQFWFQRLVNTFNDGPIVSHSVSVATIRGFYVLIAFQFAVMESIAVAFVSFSTEIRPLKSYDLNPYKGLNDNVVFCFIKPNLEMWLTVLGCFMIITHLAMNGFLAYSYVRKLQQVFCESKRQSGAKEQRLIRKSVTMALVTNVSTAVGTLFAAVTDIWVWLVLDAFVNTLCVALYFEFASDKYQCLCGRIEYWIMSVFATKRTTKSTATHKHELQVQSVSNSGTDQKIPETQECARGLAV